MCIHLVSPFVGKKTAAAPIDAPKWLSIFCDYLPIRGQSETNTAVLQYKELSARKANLSAYFRELPYSIAKTKVSEYLYTLLELQETGAKTLSLFTLMNPEVYKKKDVSELLYAICKDILNPSQTITSDTNTRPTIQVAFSTPRKENKSGSVHLCDSSIDSSCLRQSGAQADNAAAELIIQNLQEKLSASTQNQIFLHKLLINEQSNNKMLESRISDLSTELEKAQEELKMERQKVEYLFRRIKEGALDSKRLTLEDINEAYSPIMKPAQLPDEADAECADITLDELIYSLPNDPKTQNVSIMWDNIPGELNERCSSSLQITRNILQPKAKPDIIQVPSEMQVIEYENQILELQQKLLDADMKLNNAVEDAKAEYELQLRKEVCRVRSEIEQEFQERLRSLNPKAWYEYIEKK